MKREEKIQILADVIQNLLQQVDLFTSTLTKNDFELLDEAQKGLEHKISTKKNGMILFNALGVSVDTFEDEMKLSTIKLLIDLMKTRIEYRENLIQHKKEEQNRLKQIEEFRRIGLID